MFHVLPEEGLRHITAHLDESIVKRRRNLGIHLGSHVSGSGTLMATN
jgi:hypothetical protein